MDLDLPVPPVPPATRGVAWLRATVARFSEGEAHTRRRALAEQLLAAIPPESLRRPGDHVATLAEALGAPRAITRDVRATAAAYHPHLPPSPAADAAVARLVAAFGNRWDEPTAARIGLLVQATTSTDALIAGATPPVPATRRVRDGQVIEVPLDGAPFGAGRHACPGRAHALVMAEGARAFHRLHHADTPLLLPNAWDCASAAALAEAGFAAIGTTSLGVAAAAGLPDAEGRAKAQTLDLARRITHLPVPITVDVEAGFGADPADLAAELHATGVAGINVEDGRGDHLADPAEQADLIRRAKAAAPALFVNARVDCHWLGIDRDSALDRALRYADAGADGVFLPGLTDPAGIERAVAALPVPLNLLAQLDLRTLTDLGVKRVSTGSLLFRAALGAAVATAEAFRDGLPTPPAPSYERVQALAQRG